MVPNLADLLSLLDKPRSAAYQRWDRIRTLTGTSTAVLATVLLAWWLWSLVPTALPVSIAALAALGAVVALLCSAAMAYVAGTVLYENTVPPPRG